MGTGLALAWHSPMSPYSPIKRRVRKRTVRAAEGRIRIIIITLNLKDFSFSTQSSQAPSSCKLPLAGTTSGSLPATSRSASRAEAQHELEHQQTIAQQKIPSPIACPLPTGLCWASPPRITAAAKSSAPSHRLALWGCSLQRVLQMLLQFSAFFVGEKWVSPPGNPLLPAHGRFLPDFPTLSAPITRTFASIFRAVGPGISMRAGWSGVKLALRRSGSRSPMPSTAMPRRRSQWRVRLLSAQPRSQRFPRHPGDPRGPYPSPQPQGRCRGSCRRPDEKLCYRSDCPECLSVPGAGPASSQHGRRPGSTGCLHQLLHKLHPRRLPTPAPQARRPLAGPRSPLSLPHGDRGNACEEQWTDS